MGLALFGKRKRASPLGLDLGTTAVRAVQLIRTGDAWTVARFCRCEREAGAGAESLGRLVARCLAIGGTPHPRVHAALAAGDFEVHALELPEKILSGGDRTGALVVENEVRRLMTFADAEVEVRHWGLPPTSAGGAPNALGVAARRSAVESVVDLCDGAGAVCRTVDLGAWALARVGQALGAWGDKELWGVLDIGHRQSRLVLCVNRAPVLVRVIGDGAEAWTKRIADTLKISEKAAEVQKREHGIAGSGGETQASELASLILGALRGDLQKLAGQVKRSFEFVLSCYPQHRAVGIILAGGGSRLRGVDEQLGQTLGIKVRSASACLASEGCRLRSTLPKREPLEEYAVAVGLAMGEADDEPG